MATTDGKLSTTERIVKCKYELTAMYPNCDSEQSAICFGCQHCTGLLMKYMLAT